MGAEPRTVPLGHGRALTVRAMRPADVAGLERLYEELSDEDRHRRFFSAFHPGQAFLERWAGVGERGGVGLAAVVADGDSEELVGEVGYDLLPNGDGEFALTVSPRWRGWLGPYLLDALVEEAAERGVPNLEADILLENRSMLALVRHRGYATLDNDDFTVVRVVIGTHSAIPGWPPVHDRPRVVVEVPGGRWAGAAAAGDAGFTLAACGGPRPDGRARCPVLRGERCPLAADADVIIVALPPGDARAEALLSGHRRLHGGVPVIVEASIRRDLALAGEGPSSRRPSATAVTEAVVRTLADLTAPPGPDR